MDDREFDLAIEKMLSDERKKESMHTESIERERLAVVIAFKDHLDAVSALQAPANVDEFLESLFQAEAQSTDSDDDDSDNALLGDLMIEELDALVQADLEKFPILLSGEMQISGHGIYMYDADPIDDEDRISEMDSIEDGATLIGDIHRYVVAPMVSFDAYMRAQYIESDEEPDFDDAITEEPGLWLLMKNVDLIDQYGGTERRLDYVWVPMNYPSLHIEKVTRHTEAVLNAPEETPVVIEVATHFKSDFILEIGTDMENDLNHNEYTAEEVLETAKAHEAELGIYMSAVDHDELFVLSASSAHLASGREVDFSNLAVQYVDSLLMNTDGNWRVTHVFEVQTDLGPDIVHVLPEHLEEIRRFNEE